MDFDPVGSYSRPDILYVTPLLQLRETSDRNSTLNVNTKPGVNVAFNGA